MRLLTRVLVTAAALLPVAAAPAVASAPDAVRLPAPDLPDYLIIGSSMASILEMSAGAEGVELLTSRHSVILDAKGCRTLIKPSCYIGNNPAPPNALATLRAYAGRFDEGVVISVGANDPTYGENGIEAAVRAILDEASRQGIPWVAWLTYREDSSVGPKMRAHNAVLRQLASTEKRLVLADWNSLADTLPSGWISGDGIHIGSQAATVLAGLMADTLDLMSMAGPGRTTCNLSTSPRRVAGANYDGSATTLSRANATGLAKRLQVRCP
jgi:hypothetical protein